MITLLFLVALVAFATVAIIKNFINPFVGAAFTVLMCTVLSVAGGVVQGMVTPPAPTSSRLVPLVEVDGAYVASTATKRGALYSYFTEGKGGHLEEHLVSNITLTFGDEARVIETTMETPGGPWFWLWPQPAAAQYDIQVPKSGIVR